MSFRNSKVVIIGCGNVGSTTAYTLVNQGLCEEIVLIDINQEKAYAEALDLQHSVFFMSRNITVRAGNYADCKGADIVVITASAPMAKDSHDRLAMLAPSLKIFRSITEQVMASGFDGIFVVVSNPVEIVSYFVWKLSGLPRERIVGAGTTLDMARLCCEISGLYDLDAKSVSAYITGEHGDSEVTLWSTAVVGGKPLEAVLEDNKNQTGLLDKKVIEKRVAELGWEIFNRKGNTCYGIAAAAAALIKSILFNENRIYPVSAGLNGEYGCKDLFLSVPAILGRDGIKDIVEIELSEEEKAKLEKSASILTSFYQELGI